MLKRILVSGLFGGVTLLLFTGLANGVFGFTARLEMNPVPNERIVYALLKESLVVPGAYMANPELTVGGEFPAGEPVFGIRYSGVGHEAAPLMSLVEPGILFVSAILVAGLLSVTSARVMTRYAHRVLFVASIGLLLAVFGDLSKFGIGGHPAGSALWLALNHLVSWVLAGLVMAGFMRAPRDAVGAT